MSARRRRYAAGSRSVAECQRSGQKMRYSDLVEDGNIPGLLVHPDWYEPRHPQELPVDASDSVALWHPAPELSPDNGAAISALTASWAPAAVNESLAPGGLSATTYTFTAAGGYAPYTYSFRLTGSTHITIELQTATTLKLRADSTIGVYPVTVIGTVTDSLGQQKTASFTVTETVASVGPANLHDFIAALLPVHWWRFNEASGSIADIGSVGNMTLAPFGAGTFTYSLPGPASDSSEQSVKLAGLAYFNDDGTGPGVGSYAAGTVALFIHRIESPLSFNNVMYFDDGADFSNAMFFGMGLNVAGDLHRAEMTFMSGLGNQRSIYATEDLVTDNQTWQCFVFTADGVGAPKIYVNGTLATNSEITSGTVPAATTWFSSAARIRMAYGTYPFGSVLSAADQQASNGFILSTVMTQQQVTDMMSYLPTP